MKYLLILALILFQFGYIYSQPPGGGGMQRGGQSGQNRPPQKNNEEKEVFEVVNINDAAGLITYDPKIVIKEAKIKKAEEEALMSQLITEYNKKIIHIKKTNKVKLETIELTSLGQQKKAIERKDLKKILEIDKYINEELHPIKIEVMEAEKALNSKIESSFSEKTNKKWIKYFEKQKEANQPKLPKGKPNKPDFDSDQNNQMQ